MSTRTIVRSCASVARVVAFLVAPLAARATTFTVSGTLSGSHPVSASATFLTSGTTLTLTLVNTSPTPATLHPDQVLTSFYFDMLTDGTTRVGLTYVSGSGDVFRIVGGGMAAEPYRYVPPVSGTAFTPGAGSSDLVASGKDYRTWYFRKDLNVTQPPSTAYGIGTVGNSTGFGANGFPAQYVDGLDFGIFSGAASDPRGNLNTMAYPYLVGGSATFRFVADRDISAYEFSDPYVFGFGTNPDQAISFTPEPTGLEVPGMVMLACWGIVHRWRSRGRRRTPAVDRNSARRIA